MTRMNKKSQEKKIKALDKAWGDACDAHDAKAVAAFYATNATCVWPDQKAIHGRPAILKAWITLCKDPALKLRFTAKRITISKSGDMATDFGIVHGQFTTPTGIIKVVFKYLVVWIADRGSWKVLFDTYNYDEPAPSAPGGGGSGDVMQKKSGA